MSIVIVAKCISVEKSTHYNMVMLTSRQDQPKTQYSPSQSDLPKTHPTPPQRPLLARYLAGEPMATRRPFSGIYIHVKTASRAAASNMAKCLKTLDIPPLQPSPVQHSQSLWGGLQ
ncbi:hypothetical protein L211DRAFT_680790 [Terfezia boudieri ATCC MYA-4762]|uniref:Uncharacterized protein n=1 Tax=Terfezia boudieri ATCC MYA-4762 TaxID=1051890 RepID=A0A3N4LXR7_9PEZI|nr:hypothetical protein L211DRAFT_680790 [Terfezia boudieri ATCC MYA-4762]